MKRLTKYDESGNADVVGVNGADLRCNLEFGEINRVTNALDKLAKYEDLEEQGKLLKLPCAMGDTVYAFDMAEVIELKIIEISLFSRNRKNIINVKCLNTDRDCFRNFVKDEFDKTVFLKKEKAKAVLKEL